MGQSIAFVSGKGGTGKTTITAGIATCLAALGHSVICVDADVGARNLDISLGMRTQMLRTTDFADILRGTIAPEAALIGHPTIPGLELITAPLTGTISEIHTERFRYLIRALTHRADFVLVDAAAGLDAGFRMVADACRHAVVVATTDTSSLRVASRAASLLGPDKPAMLVINRVIPKLVQGGHAANIDDAMDETGLPLLGLVPEDEMVPSTAFVDIPLVLSGGNGASGAMLRIARRLTGENIPLKRLKQWKVDGA